MQAAHASVGSGLALPTTVGVRRPASRCAPSAGRTGPPIRVLFRELALPYTNSRSGGYPFGTREWQTGGDLHAGPGNRGDRCLPRCHAPGGAPAGHRHVEDASTTRRCSCVGSPRGYPPRNPGGLQHLSPDRVSGALHRPRVRMSRCEITPCKARCSHLWMGSPTAALLRKEPRTDRASPLGRRWRTVSVLGEGKGHAGPSQLPSPPRASGLLSARGQNAPRLKEEDA
jgi:hypothetical protein